MQQLGTEPLDECWSALAKATPLGALFCPWERRTSVKTHSNSSNSYNPVSNYIRKWRHFHVTDFFLEWMLHLFREILWNHCLGWYWGMTRWQPDKRHISLKNDGLLFKVNFFWGKYMWKYSGKDWVRAKGLWTIEKRSWHSLEEIQKAMYCTEER
jgi:hypothetical protein